jgi:DNA-binding NarL/FixJ family response regulator
MAGELRGLPCPDDTGALLDRRECDVLAASARGALVSEVATELGLSREQVRASLTSAMRKLGARSKLEAVLIALQQGLILAVGVELVRSTVG